MSVEDAPERFKQKYQVDEESGCWEWTGAKTPQGYGSFASGVTNGKRGGALIVGAHRWSLEYYGGIKIPEGSMALHTCDNRGCVNPEHLYIGTPKRNMRDMSERGRSLRGAKSKTARLTEKMVAGIRDRILSGRTTAMEEARKYALAVSYVAALVRGETWKHVPSPAKPKPPWRPVREAAKMLGITESAVLKRAAVGKLERRKVSGRVYVKVPGGNHE